MYGVGRKAACVAGLCAGVLRWPESRESKAAEPRSENGRARRVFAAVLSANVERARPLVS